MAAVEMTTQTNVTIEYRARRLWVFRVAIWLAHYLPSRAGFALARIVACLVVVVGLRMGSRDVWRPVPVDEHIEYGVLASA
jgi:hypothetical protein